MSEESDTDVRSLLAGQGEKILRLVADEETPSDEWEAWLRIPFERAAAEGDASLTMSLLKAGAKGDAVLPAVRGGHTSLVENLLAHGQSAQTADEENVSSLHFAAALENEQIMRSLLEAGADVKAMDETGRTPLHVASIEDDTPAVKALLAAGADCNVRVGGELIALSALDLAARNDNVDVLKVLLEHGAKTDGMTHTGLTPMHAAAMSNAASAINFLNEHSHLCADAPDDFGQTPLHSASLNGCVQSVKALLSCGADKSARTHGGLRSVYMEFDACMSGVFLLAREEWCVRGNWSPLDLAAYGGHTDVLQVLLTAGAAVNASDDERGYTALYHAAKSDKVGAIDALVAAGANVHAKARTHAPTVTPLHAATLSDTVDAISALVRHGADLTSTDDRGKTALQLAADEGSLNSLNALVAMGADPNLCNDRVSPPLSRAANSGQEFMFGTLLKFGADVN